MSYYRTTRARSTGTSITTASAVDLGLDPGVSEYDDGAELTRWYTCCDSHGAAVGHQTLALARSFAAVPAEWCDDCRELLSAAQVTA